MRARAVPPAVSASPSPGIEGGVSVLMCQSLLYSMKLSLMPSSMQSWRPVFPPCSIQHTVRVLNRRKKHDTRKTRHSNVRTAPLRADELRARIADELPLRAFRWRLLLLIVETTIHYFMCICLASDAQRCMTHSSDAGAMPSLRRTHCGASGATIYSRGDGSQGDCARRG